MKINANAVINDYKGKPAKIEEPGEKPTTRDFELRDVLCPALTSPIEGERPSPKEAFARFQLAQKLWAGGEVEMTAEDVAMAQRLVSKAWSPGIAGAVYGMLEGS